MKDSGVIFINIDINELAQLKLICDGIFGESNLISLISVKVKSPAGVGQQSFIFDVCEYVLMYAKNISIFKITHQKLPVEYEILTEQFSSYNKIVLDFGQPRFVQELSRQNVGKIKIYECQNYLIQRTTSLSFKEYAKNRDKIFRDCDPG